MNHLQKHLSASLIALAALTAAPMAASAATAPSLGTASSFAALGGAGVTCTSPTPALPAITVTGDVGSLLLAPTSVTGFPGYTPGALPCSLSGTVQLGATQAHADFLAAFNTLASNAPTSGNVCPSADATHNLVGDIGNQTLAPGLYCLSGVITLTGTLTLDLAANGGGDGSGIWVFKSTDATVAITPIGGAIRSKVVMANNGSACNVYWQSATAATFVNTDFLGNVLAGSKISFAGSTLAGRAFANIESVTMTGSSITSCGGTLPPPPPPCDKNHKHHKHCKHNDNDKPHCDGDNDGHDGGHDGHGDKDGHDSGYHNFPFGSNDKHDNKGDNKH